EAFAQFVPLILIFAIMMSGTNWAKASMRKLSLFGGRGRPRELAGTYVWCRTFARRKGASVLRRYHVGGLGGVGDNRLVTSLR
ncbi:MAG: hypothetical protein AAFN80_18100, partial [Pseudomonadota bacterium]